MKQCSVCREVKTKENFTSTNSYCVPCKKEYDKAWYLKHQAERKVNTAARRKILREKLLEVKNKPCKDCGIKYPPYVMDFDHNDPSSKVSSVSDMHNANWDKIELEIAKCDLVCSNCHRERTYKRGFFQ